MLDRYPKPKLIDALKEVNKWKMTAAVVLSLLFSFILYQFFKLLKASFFFVFFHPNRFDYPGLTLFSLAEDLLLASVMVVLGLNLAFEFLFNVPLNKRMRPGERKRSGIINDQMNLKWYFIYFFYVFNVIFFFLYLVGVTESYRIMEFPIAAGIMVVLVFYFHSWMSLRRFYRLKIRWVFAVLLINLFIALVYVNIKIVDFNTVYSAYEQKYPLLKKDFELPIYTEETPFFDAYFGQNLYLFNDHIAEEIAPVLVYNEERIEIEQAGKKIFNQLNKFPRWFAARSVPVIYADADLDMSVVNLLMKVLQAYNFRTIVFAVKGSKYEGYAVAPRLEYLYYFSGWDKVPLHFVDMQEFVEYLEIENAAMMQE